MKRQKVSFIGLGSSSFTPLLYSYLREHPEVNIPEAGTNFFSDMATYVQGIDWYENNFSGCDTGGKCGELACRYLEHLPAANLIAETYPSARLFAVIGNPLLGVRIDYLEALSSGKITDDITLAGFIKSYPETLTKYLFGKQLTHYYSYYSPTDLMVIVGSDLVDDPLKVLSDFFDYLEIDPKFVPLVLKSLIADEEDLGQHKPGFIKRTLKLIWRIVTKPYYIVLAKLKKPDILPDRLWRKAKQIPISSDLEEYLVKYYYKDVKTLSALLHRDLIEEWGMEKLK
ncbi:MAG: hypothetical protein H6779_01670 [Candidatus Nomurabacteria bacterium]|nr:hypothetical protein [Candidatus Nomurabacteria bacterium]USN88136.1 MAG: hypothetical protein H6779_01670 [Candidatus Nomurabacteria bacterium]